MAEEQSKKPSHHEFEKVMVWLRRLHARGFFGTVLLGFQAGKVTQVEPKPVIKPGDPLE